MKLSKYIAIAGLVALAASCSKWTDTERIEYTNQLDLHREYPMIDITDASMLKPRQVEYYKALREYRKTPHVMGFGYFDGWTGMGNDPKRYLRTLPDSIDLVSLWIVTGNLSEAQKQDLKIFQEVKGGKAMICWSPKNIGAGLTPALPDAKKAEYAAAGVAANAMDRKWRLEFWGNGNEEDAVRGYANAICDTIEKYNLDGFDIDHEPDWGGNGDLELRGNKKIGTKKDSQNKLMHIFIETMYNRLHPAGRLLAVDGQPDMLTEENAYMVDYYIWQAYELRNTTAARAKAQQGHIATSLEPTLGELAPKTIMVAEFEKDGRGPIGGIPGYTSERLEFYNHPGAQIFDYATLDFTEGKSAGKRVAGFGVYKLGNDPDDYKWMRQALYFANVKYPGQFTGVLK